MMTNFASFLTYVFGFLGAVTALLLGGVKFTKSQRGKYAVLRKLDGKQPSLIIYTLLFWMLAYAGNAWKDALATEEIIEQINAKNLPIAEYLIQKHYGGNIDKRSYFNEHIQSEQQKNITSQYIGKWKATDESMLRLIRKGSSEDEDPALRALSRLPKKEMEDRLSRSSSKPRLYLEFHDDDYLSMYMIVRGEIKYLRERAPYTIRNDSLFWGGVYFPSFWEGRNSLTLLADDLELDFEQVD